MESKGNPPPVTTDMVVEKIGDAEDTGKFKALDDLIAEEGWDITSGTLVALAAKDERTKGKTPDELAQALRDEPSLFRDLEAMQPGGELFKEDDASAEEPVEPPAEEMTEYLKGSSSMKDKDPKDAMKKMKGMGMTSPKEMETNSKKKLAFMENFE